MFVLNRFQVPDQARPGFEAQAGAAVEVLRDKEGCEAIDLVQNMDEPELWALVARWRDVGSYRRALQGYESKMTVVPLLSLSIDEASAYGTPDEVGENRPRGQW